MAHGDSLFSVQHEGDVLILAPLRDMEALAALEIEKQAPEVEAALGLEEVKHLVIDFASAGYFSSSALSYFTRLWKKIRERSGQVAVCNVSEGEREILRLTRLDTLWAVCNTREEALEQVHSSG